MEGIGNEGVVTEGGGGGGGRGKLIEFNFGLELASEIEVGLKFE